jgi:hypothetical protein
MILAQNWVEEPKRLVPTKCGGRPGDPRGTLLKTWARLGSTQAVLITPKNELWVLTHRTENITYDTLKGRLLKLDLESDKILGKIERPGHGMGLAPNRNLFVAGLTGNVFRWYPDPKWPETPPE